MSILVKGVGMPKKGACIDIVIFDDGTVVYYDDDRKIGEAVELPDHGRLIDAKSISEKIDNIWDGRPLSMLGCEILAMIEKEPTVIEAERE